jgi:hypothetical protein
VLPDQQVLLAQAVQEHQVLLAHKVQPVLPDLKALLVQVLLVRQDLMLKTDAVII